MNDTSPLAAPLSTTAMAPPLSLSTPQRVYLWLAALSCTCLLIADIVGIKLFRIPLPVRIPVPWGDGAITAIEHTCGMLTFPITFIITDLVNDYYGKKAARRIAYIGLSMGLFAFLIINAAQAMPRLEADYNVSESAFHAVFASAKGMYIASMVAYIIGQLCDIALFDLFKRLTRGKFLWLRATGSTVVSQLIDSFFVTLVAFNLWRTWFPDPATPPIPLSSIFSIALTGYALKFFFALAVTPLIYLGHYALRRGAGMSPLPPASHP